MVQNIHALIVIRPIVPSNHPFEQSNDSDDDSDCSDPQKGLSHQFGVVKPFRDSHHGYVWHEYQNESVGQKQYKRQWGQNDSHDQFPFVNFDVFQWMVPWQISMFPFDSGVDPFNDDHPNPKSLDGPSDFPPCGSFSLHVIKD